MGLYVCVCIQGGCVSWYGGGEGRPPLCVVCVGGVLEGGGRSVSL